MEFSEFKKAINLYCKLCDLLTSEELEELLEYLQKDISPEESEKWDREYHNFIHKWLDKYPKEMHELAKKIENKTTDENEFN